MNECGAAQQAQPRVKHDFFKKKQDLVCMCVFTKCKPTNPSKREKEEQQRSVRESERKNKGGS